MSYVKIYKLVQENRNNCRFLADLCHFGVEQIRISWFTAKNFFVVYREILRGVPQNVFRQPISNSLRENREHNPSAILLLTLLNPLTLLLVLLLEPPLSLFILLNNKSLSYKIMQSANSCAHATANVTLYP